MEVEGLSYTENPLMPGAKFFECKTLSASLSTKTCAERHLVARDLSSAETCKWFHCKNCVLGMVHAGKQEVPSQIFGRLICVRCRRSSTRLIKHGICISCANRGYELLRSRNARGTVPINLKPLNTLSAMIFNATTESVQLRKVERVVDLAEIFLSQLRTNDAQLLFGRAPVSPY